MKEIIFNSILFVCFMYVFVVVGNVFIHFLLTVF